MPSSSFHIIGELTHSVQDNILFGSPFDAGRYDKGRDASANFQISSLLMSIPTVIEQCGLRRDLEILDAGDLTEVGEKGLTLR